MKPILFNSEMVRAILDGRKTTTRRIIKPQLPNIVKNMDIDPLGYLSYQTDDRYLDGWRNTKSPYKKGDVLYVRETWQCFNPYSDKEYVYKATNDCSDVINMKWHPSLHMPKEAARIFLKVANVRVERLQEIDVDGAISEGAWGNGIPHLPFSLLYAEHPNASCNAVVSFAHLWDSTIKKSDLDRYGWDANPFVWAIEFERCDNPELLGGDGS